VQKSEYGSAKWALVGVYKFVLTYYHVFHVEGFFSFFHSLEAKSFAAIS